ncbi:uncharacterized protein LOC118434006 [Folsomia candida]|uniref:uncharacterized protein LOC118434006 n=1 Tax=Folsomia candida TaxID=158441 RepID=UPI001604FED8|nr:uncharacterized protein LOC118434006 [Folsomia candida]
MGSDFINTLYYAAQMRSTGSVSKANKNAQYRDPEHPLYQVIQDSKKASKEATPPMDIIYIASLIKPEIMNENLVETMKLIEPVQSGDGLQDYIGKYSGHNGQFTMRPDNFYLRTGNQVIYNRTYGSDKPRCCVEKRVVLCDSTYTKEIGEGFLMSFGQEYNRVHECERYPITEASTPPADIIKKAHKYVNDKVPMFEFVEDLDRCNPPLWATVDQVTTLPYTFCKKDLIMRYDPQFPDDKRHYKTFKTFAKMVEEFGDPPPNYFITKDHSRDELLLQFEDIVRQRGNN